MHRFEKLQKNLDCWIVDYVVWKQALIILRRSSPSYLENAQNQQKASFSFGSLLSSIIFRLLWMLCAFVNCEMLLQKRLNLLIQVRNEYSPQLYKLLYNCQFKDKEGSQRMGAGGFFYKSSTTLPLIKIYRMSLISAGSISQHRVVYMYSY
jgi:hypothetical protein